MAYINVDLDEFDTDDLIEELEFRGYKSFKEEMYETTPNEMIEKIYQLRRTNQDFSKELDELIYSEIGRI